VKKKYHHATIDSVSSCMLVKTLLAYDNVLEEVEMFKYLGRLLVFDSNIAQVVQSNLRKAQKCWDRILKVLRVENIAARVCVMFYIWFRITG